MMPSPTRRATRPCWSTVAGAIVRRFSNADWEKVAGGVCGGSVDAVDVGDAGAEAVYDSAGCEDDDDDDARLRWVERWRCR